MNGKNEELQTRTIDKTEAYLMVGSAIFMGTVLLMSPFVTGFVIAMMALPVAIDLEKNGKKNILNRAWKELKQAFGLVKADMWEKSGLKKKQGMSEDRHNLQSQDRGASSSGLPAKNTAAGSFNTSVAGESPAAEAPPTFAPDKPAPRR